MTTTAARLQLAWKRAAERGSHAAALRPLLRGLSGAYALLASARRAAYSGGWLQAASLGPLPVISVGNLSWGGTGKTPMVELLGRMLHAHGAVPLVLSRGYGDDEWRQLRQSLPFAMHGVGADRAATARALLDSRRLRESLREQRPSAVLLDDGFQHMRLKRDLDIVMVNAELLLGATAATLPLGCLREPPQALAAPTVRVIALHHADAVGGDELAAAEALLRRHAGDGGARRTLVLHTAARASGLRRASADGESQQRLPLDCLAGREVGAICAVGWPDGFFRALRTQLGVKKLLTTALPDHGAVCSASIRALAGQLAAADGERTVVVTEKDWHRAGGGAGLARAVEAAGARLLVLESALEVLSPGGEAELERLVGQVLDEK